MKVTAVDQFIPTLAARDAIGSHALHLQALLVELGYSSELFVGNAVPELSGRSRNFSQYRGGKEKVMLYQASTGSEVADFVLSRPEPLLMSYHNLTPPQLFEQWEPQVALELESGRQQIVAMSHRTTHAIADSCYNENELIAMGYKSTSVSPPMVDATDKAAGPDRALADWLADWKQKQGSIVLFVGRLAPNKAQHDLIKAFVLYRRLYDPNARLCIVGGVASDRYATALYRFVEDLGLSHVIDMPGAVSGAELVAYYQAADVFGCLSDHEGYCVPVVEAMHYGVPVVAHGSSAVPETAGDAALLLDSKAPLRVATALNRAVNDASVNAELIKRGQRRAQELSLSTNIARYRETLQIAIGLIERQVHP